MNKLILLLFTFVVATGVNAQSIRNSQDSLSNTKKKYAWELGIGGSIYQFNRMTYMKYTPTATLNIADIKWRHAVYTGQIYAARELSNVFALDFQGGLGKIEDKWLTHLGIGLQWRLAHYFKSPWIDPYFRAGVGYMYKGYNISYTGNVDGVQHEFENVGNKDGADAKSVFPVSAGVGVNMWLNDRFGIGLSGDYLYIPKSKVANSLQGTIRLLFRFGGKSKKPVPVISYIDEPIDKNSLVRTVEVEKIVVKEKIVEKVVNLNEILSNIYFDFDKHDIKPEYDTLLNDIKNILLKNTANRYLLSGFTDSHGSVEYNLRLSERRVNAIREALVNRGVPAEMLKTRGQGKKIYNLPPGTSEHAREGDRKVIIELITNQEYWNQL